MNKVTKVARMLAAKPMDITVMALLDGGMLRRHKSWLKVRHSFDSVFYILIDAVEIKSG